MIRVERTKRNSPNSLYSLIKISNEHLSVYSQDYYYTSLHICKLCECGTQGRKHQEIHTYSRTQHTYKVLIREMDPQNLFSTPYTQIIYVILLNSMFELNKIFEN